VRRIAQLRFSDLFRRIWQHKRLIAIAVGVMLAGMPLLAFDFWLADVVDRERREDASNLAKRAVTLAETRIRRATTAVEELLGRGINSCSPQNIAELQKVVFTVAAVKDIVVLAADGQILCSHLGAPIGEQWLVANEPLAEPDGFTLEVVKVGTDAESFIRVRAPADSSGRSLAALVPSSLFVPMSASQGGVFNASARVTSRSGAVLAESPSFKERVNSSDAVIGNAKSERNSFAGVIAAPKAGGSSVYRDLSKISLFVPCAIAVLLMLFAALVPKRQPSNPVTELQNAIDNGEFVPYYQPIVDIRSGKLLGAEVLARWRKPDGTLVMPGSFIPLAETSGLIVDLTLNLMRRVCADAGPMIGARPGFKISFNFTAKLFASRTIVRDVRRIFAGSPIDMSQVVIEVTEREPIVDLTETRQVIAALQGLGARVAIDDVGTGHSGLSYMLKLGVDIIKIDKMFVDAIGVDRKSTTIVETLVDLAHNMRMDIVAEGVENFEQVAHLRELGIRAAQGYVFAPPLPGSAFLQLVNAIDPQQPKTEAVTNAGGTRRYMSARSSFAS
jgi:sensor c-di-GMP phosphodiesterase-like protein